MVERPTISANLKKRPHVHCEFTRMDIIMFTPNFIRHLKEDKRSYSSCGLNIIDLL